jgi:hypothetical protein
LEVSDGQLTGQTLLTLPIQEHANSIGIFVNLDNAGDKEQAFVNMVYELNEKLKEKSKYLLRMDQRKTNNNFQGSISDQLNDQNVITLEEWKNQLPGMQKETSFIFCPITENGSVTWQIGSSSASKPSTNSDLDNNKTNIDNSTNDESGVQSDISLDSASGTNTELNNESSSTVNRGEKKPQYSEDNKAVPVLTLRDLSRIEKIESAPNWYSLPGLGSFFDAGNGWLYQPEMGWCFSTVCNDGCSVWIYNQTTGWLWLREELPNMAYMMGELGNSWMYYPNESIGKSEVIFNYANNVWIVLN